MSTLPEEKENHLCFDEKTRQYHIFCSSPIEKTRMEKAGFKPYKTDAEGNGYYRVERKQISFRSISNKPRQKREMTEEHKAKLLAGLEEGRKKKKAKKEENNSED